LADHGIVGGKGRFDRYTLTTGPQPARGLLEFWRMICYYIYYNVHYYKMTYTQRIRCVGRCVWRWENRKRSAGDEGVGRYVRWYWGGVKNKIVIPATIGCKRIMRIYNIHTAWPSGLPPNKYTCIINNNIYTVGFPSTNAAGRCAFSRSTNTIQHYNNNII